MKKTHPFAERLRMLRAKSQLRQEAMAAELGVSQGLIGKWERGESEPTVSQASTIARMFNVSGDYLLGLSDHPQGLEPDTWIVDLDIAEARDWRELWCVKVPRRFKIVDYREMKRIEDGGTP